MKRTIAKEVLLLVACVVVLLLVALFGWTRNGWLNHRIENSKQTISEHQRGIDSLEARTALVELNFVDLFDSTFVRNRYYLFVWPPAWHKGLDPLGTMSRVNTAQLASVLRDAGYLSSLNVDSIQAIPSPFPSSLDLGRAVRNRFPEDYHDFADSELGNMMLRRYPFAFSNLVTEKSSSGIEPWSKYARTEENEAHVGGPKAAKIEIEKIDDEDAAKNLATVQDYRRITFEELGEGVDPTLTDSAFVSVPFILARAFTHEPAPHKELQKAYTFLRERGSLKCSFDELLYTLQRKPVPPAKEMLDALAKLRTTVDELQNEGSGARLGLWSEAKQWAVLKWAAIVLLVLVYPLRLLVLGTLWAIKVLRK